jgi:hypothetical protein
MRRLILLAAVLACGCGGKTLRFDGPGAPMTEREAVKALAASLAHSSHFAPSKPLIVNRRKIVYWENFGEQTIVPAQVKDLRVKEKPKPLEASRYFVLWSEPPRKPGHDGERLLVYDDEGQATRCAEALAALRTAALAPDTEEADFAAFSARIKNPRPPMSEEARTSKALAEDAFKRKNFAAALEAYFDALDKHPLWPEGHYNAALLAAEVEDYELAAKHMRRYIALSPDEKDVDAAQEKYLLWRHKAKE